MTNSSRKEIFFSSLGRVLVIIIAIMASSPFIFPPSALAAAQCTLNSAFETTGGTMQTPGTMNYLITAQNTGGATCSSASISVYYDPNETFVSSSPAPTSHGYYWSLGDLAPGAQDTITLVTNLSAALPAGDSPDQMCLSANNGTDACSYASSASTATAPPANTASAPAPVASATPPTAAPSPASIASGQELGLWDWDTPSTVSSAAMQSAVNDAAANGFTAIYLSIDDYLTIDALPAGAAKSAQLSNYENEVATFLSFAAQKGIAVDAEAGSDNWAEPQNLWKSADIMSFVANYNSTHAQKFRGVQYDVEPYLLSAYNNDEAPYLTQYVEMVEGLVNQDKTLGLPLSLDVPSFYNDVIQWTPEVTVDGITAYTYNQLLRLLSEIPNSTMIIMAYRNTADGSNGTIGIAQPEVQEAVGAGVNVIVGQETGNVPPNYVTFYGETAAQLFGQMAIVDRSFSSDSSFTGMAVDYLEPFMALAGVALPGASTGGSGPSPAPVSTPAPAPAPAPTPAPVQPTAPAVPAGGGGGGGGGGGYFYASTPATVPVANNTSASNALSLVSDLRSLTVQLIASTDDHPLTVGSKGTDVWALQVYLEIDGAGPASRALLKVGPTGTFGSLTRNALAEYQKSAAITPDIGYFGIKTRSKIIGTIAAVPFENTPSALAAL